MKKINFNFFKSRKGNYNIDDEDYLGEGDVVDEESDEILERGENVKPSTSLWFYFGIFIIFVALFARLWILQMVQGAENRSLAEGNRIRSRSISAPRGLIYDRNNNVIAKNVPDFVLAIYPADLPKKQEERDNLYKQISDISGTSFEEIENLVDKHKDYFLESVVIKEGIPHDEALILEEKVAKISGLAVEKRSTRNYTSGLALSHLLGYIGDISEEEYKENPQYLLTDQTGKAGIESYYEKEIRGISGKEQIEVDSEGRLQKILASIDPIAGSSLVLNIDTDLQKQVRAALQEQLDAQKLPKGVAIVSDPRNGEILSMVSLPDFDNNIFSTPSLKDIYPALINDQNRPLFNRVVSGVYPAGSTIKPVVAAAALQEGVVSINDWIIDDKGVLEVPNQYDPSIIYRYVDEEAHGGVNITKALAVSCNVFFYTIGGGYGKIKGLGVERLDKYFSLFGLGAKTEIDIDGEAKGLVPDPDWKQKNKKEPWVLGDTYHLSIGQGDLGVTPLQVNNYTQAIANGGTLFKPRLAKALLSPAGEMIKTLGPEILRNNFISDGSLGIVRQGMRSCVTSGSCDKLSVLPVSSAGKTGTAQPGGPIEESHGWFTAFAPYENPQIAVTVLIENGGSGYTSAEPVAVRIMQYYFSKAK